MLNIKITNRASIFERKSKKRDAARKNEKNENLKWINKQSSSWSTQKGGKNDTFVYTSNEERVGSLEDEELGVGQVYDVVDAVIALPAHRLNLTAARPRNAFWKSGHLRLFCIFTHEIVD